MHTKEPWEIADGQSIGSDVVAPAQPKIRRNVARCGGMNREANAVRIVSCVNALAGLNPDAVADVVAALQACHSTLEHTRAFMLQKHGTTNPAREEALALARTALARIRGEG